MKRVVILIVVVVVALTSMIVYSKISRKSTVDLIEVKSVDYCIDISQNKRDGKNNLLKVRIFEITNFQDKDIWLKLKRDTADYSLNDLFDEYLKINRGMKYHMATDANTSLGNRYALDSRMELIIAPKKKFKVIVYQRIGDEYSASEKLNINKIDNNRFKKHIATFSADEFYSYRDSIFAPINKKFFFPYDELVVPVECFFN